MNVKWLFLVLLILIIVVGTWYWRVASKKVVPPLTPKTLSKSLGAEVYQKTQANPVSEKVPQTNPFQPGAVNPFNTYQNPFAQ